MKRRSRYLPNRDELSFISVWALPKASSMGLTLMILSERPSASAPLERSIMCWRKCLADSVLPAPDSPEMTQTLGRGEGGSARLA